MGQGCTSGMIGCVDTSCVNTQELVSEPSKKSDISNLSQIYKIESRDPVVNCIEKLDLPLALYENEFRHMEPKKKNNRYSHAFDDSFKVSPSPKIKIISSNFSEKSFNLIDKIDRTNDTESCSFLLTNSVSK